jgi:hypothetical protein
VTADPVLERAVSAVADLDPERLAELAGPALRVSAPFDDLVAPGDLAVAGARELGELCHQVAGAAGGDLREVARAVTGDAAIVELDTGDGRPITVVLRAADGELTELRWYLDPAGATA